jgi:hypothetical protein
MSQAAMKPVLSSRIVHAARILAVTADLVQIVLLPAFAPGILSPANDVIDAVVAVALIVMLGWHWAFVPAFVAEMVPFVDLVPTWTAAVLLATRGRAGSGKPPITVEPVPPPALPPGPQAPRDPSGT